MKLCVQPQNGRSVIPDDQTFAEPTSLERLTAFQESVRRYARLRCQQQQMGQRIADQSIPICEGDRTQLVELSEGLFFAGEAIKAEAMILAGTGALDRCINLIDLENRGLV